VDNNHTTEKRTMNHNKTINAWLDRPVISVWPQFTVYHLLLTAILLTTAISRFTILGQRVMSHDEVNHVVPAHTFYQGGAYRYDPVTHGPIQFHLITLSYTLFGDNDFSARIPNALFGIAVVAFALFAFKKYLGRVGSLVAGFLFMISPYISYYSRYTRNEIYIVFWGMALLWGVLRYLELGQKRTLLFITVITALHFTDKATSYIFTAEMLIFLAIIFTARVITKPWESKQTRTTFLIIAGLTLIIGLVLFAFGYDALTHGTATVGEDSFGVRLGYLDTSTRLIIGGLGLALLTGLVSAAMFLIKGIGWFGVRDERSFDLLILQGTLVLPLLGALPMDILGFNPLDYSANGVITSLLFIAPLLVIAIAIGIWWNWKVWALNIGIFWGIFIIFFTTLFTQGSGFIRGLTGALGYWLAQQGVVRGTQPLYYYALIQIPIYEFLPAFGTLLAAIIGLRILSQRKAALPADDDTELDVASETTPVLEGQSEDLLQTEVFIDDQDSDTDITPESHPLRIVDNEGELRPTPVLGLLLFWSIMSLVAFSFAGERMPWLTSHIAMPMILTSGLSFGRLLESFDWSAFKRQRGWLVVLLGLLFILTVFRTFAFITGPLPPFQGRELAQLEVTNNFLLAFIGMIASGAGLFVLVRDWANQQIGKLALILFVVILSFITIRTAFRANFILYDTAKEFLVYAHSARDPKDVLEQVEEISFRLTGGKDIVVAYDNDMLYPYWWYFRDYPNRRWFADNPTRDLRDAPVILVGSGNYGQIEPVVGDEYIRFDHTRLWWPTQVYFNLTLQRVWDAFTSAEMRAALWQIWYNRNYEPYARLENINTLTLTNWQPSDSFRMYVRKDVVSQIWEYGAAPLIMEPAVDPYEANTIALDADLVLFGTEEIRFDAPRSIAFAPDGTFYVADSRNHRILHFDQEGAFLRAFGTFGASDYATQTMAPEGYFNEPWGVAVGPDGSVYVADTWNNRIQKFTAQGQFVTMWGQFGAAETPNHFWGPRGVAVDQQGRVYITDTGNKRVVIFDSNGVNLAAFGGAGLGVGQFDEPVGIAVDDAGRLFIADTWNKRIQIMIPDGDTLSFPNHITWDIEGWFGDSLDNKPFLAIDENYQVYVADPIFGRVLVFNQHGTFLFAWGGFGSGPDEIGIVGGLAVDPLGKVWVSDARNNRLMRFPVPEWVPDEELLLEELLPFNGLEIENPFEADPEQDLP
jgi:predicted membrane-bound mannosyltransferase/DNA-binding beta-propeller fold protein YncE